MDLLTTDLQRKEPLYIRLVEVLAQLLKPPCIRVNSASTLSYPVSKNRLVDVSYNWFVVDRYLHLPGSLKEAVNALPTYK